MKKIWFCFVTKDNRTIASKLIESIENQILKFAPPYINLLILDKSHDSRPLTVRCQLFQKLIYYRLADIQALESKYSYVYTNIEYDLNKDSIQRARLQLKIASLEHKQEFEDSIIWQLDDDMFLGETFFSSNGVQFRTDRNYCQIIRDFHKLHPTIDAAVGYCSYVPPLPQFLYLRKQLEAFLSTTETVNFGFQYKDWSYHDLYYSQNNYHILPDVIAKPRERILDDIFKGKPTHPILTLNETPLSSVPQRNLLRGGNFIVFNQEVLTAIPHISFAFQEFISRRSDMLHVWMLLQNGFNVTSIDLSLIHNRNFKDISFAQMAKTYFEDFLGAIFLRYISQSQEAAMKRFYMHKSHLIDLQKLSIRLSKLYKKEYLETFRITLDKAILKFESFNWRKLKQAMNAQKAKVLSYIPTNLPNND